LSGLPKSLKFPQQAPNHAPALESLLEFNGYHGIRRTSASAMVCYLHGPYGLEGVGYLDICVTGVIVDFPCTRAPSCLIIH